MSINTGRFVLKDGETIQAVSNSISSRGIINTAPDYGKVIKTFDTGIEKGLENIIRGSSSNEVKSAVGAVGKSLGVPLGNAEAAVVDAIDSNGVIDRAFRGLSQAKSGVSQLGSACLNDFLSGMNCDRNAASSNGRYLNASDCSIDALSNIVGGMGGSTSNIFDPCALKGMLKGVVNSSSNAGLGEVYKSLGPAFDPQVVLGAGIDLVKDADFPLIKEISESNFAKEVGSAAGGVTAAVGKFIKNPLSKDNYKDITETLANFDPGWGSSGGKSSLSKFVSNIKNDFVSTINENSKSTDFNIEETFGATSSRGLNTAIASVKSNNNFFNLLG